MIMNHLSNDHLWVEKLNQVGAIWTFREGGPHASFEYANKHSAFYFNSDIVVSNPSLLWSICKDRFFQEYTSKSLSVDWIASYPANGVAIAFCLASLVGCRYFHVELSHPRITMNLRAGERVLVVTDDIFSGGSLGKTIETIEKRGGIVASPIMTLGNFSGSIRFRDRDISSLIDRPVQTWEPSSCPLCMQGSRTVPARQEWGVLQAEHEHLK
jgi:adenine/guanine phosphoribosyltransferase-like PRPP-binding protein